MTEQINESASGNEYIDYVTGKNQTWEVNHVAITKAMALLIRQKERIPTNTEISEHTGLSRQTIYTHLKQFGRFELMGEQLEQFNFVSAKILAKIAELAMDGDIRAARLSLEIMGILNKQNIEQSVMKREAGL